MSYFTIANRSIYSVQGWQHDRQRNLRYLSNICEFKPSLLNLSSRAPREERELRPAEQNVIFNNTFRIGFSLFNVRVFLQHAY